MEDYITENALDISKVYAKDLEYEDSISNYKIDEISGVEVYDNMLIVKKPNAFITLNTDSISNAERYVAFKNLWYEGNNDLTSITITDKNKSKWFYIMSDLSNSYDNVHNFWCNLGYSKEHENSYVISFSQTGVYTFDSIEILNQPLELLDKWLMTRNAEEIEYLFGEDNMLIHVNLNNDKILYASIPYSDGWDAFVDGKKVDIIQIAGFGIGIPLKSGEHSITLEYHTPYMWIDICMFLLGIVGCIITCRSVNKRI